MVWYTCSATEMGANLSCILSVASEAAPHIIFRLFQSGFVSFCPDSDFSEVCSPSTFSFLLQGFSKAHPARDSGGRAQRLIQSGNAWTLMHPLGQPLTRESRSQWRNASRCLCRGHSKSFLIIFRESGKIKLQLPTAMSISIWYPCIGSCFFPVSPSVVLYFSYQLNCLYTSPL